MKKKKYEGIINIYTSIVFNFREQEIIICNDAGRIMRPVYKVKNNKLLITKDIYNRVMDNTRRYSCFWSRGKCGHENCD